jgi:hypothetical protein
MLPGGFIRDFREAADQILEQVAHFDIGDLVRVQVDGAEALEHLPEDATLFQSLEGFGEAEFVEKYIADVGRIPGDIVDQIVVELAEVLALEAGEGEGDRPTDSDRPALEPSEFLLSP